MPESKSQPTSDPLREAIRTTQGQSFVQTAKSAPDETAQNFNQWFHAQRRRTLQNLDVTQENTDAQDSHATR